MNPVASWLEINLDRLTWLDDRIPSQVIPSQQIIDSDIVSSGDTPQGITTLDRVLDGTTLCGDRCRGRAMKQCQGSSGT